MYFLLLIISIIAIIAGSQVSAEEIKQELDEVVVTASRVKEKIKEAPVTINVISEKDLDKVKPRKAEEVLQRLPGVNSSDLGGDSTITSIRIPTHFTNPYTLVLIDGIPTDNYGSGGSGSFSEININNIAGIEVVKGPASALYGSNAIGGIINIITEDPAPGHLVRLWTELGDYGKWRSGLQGSGSGEKLSYNINLNYNYADNWREHSGVDKKTGNIKLRYAPTLQSLLTFKLDYVNFDNESVGTLDEEDFNDNWQHSYHTFTYAELEKYSPLLSYSHYFDQAELRATLAFRQLDHEVLPNYAIRPQGRGRYVGSLSQIDEDAVDLQLLYSRDFDLMRSKIVAGMDSERGNTETDTYGLAVTRDPLVNKFTDYRMGGLSKSFDMTTKVWAPYLQFQISPLDRLRLTAGARYDNVTYEVDDRLGTGEGGDMDFSQVSPKIGATYDINPAMNAYVSYSEGFVVPTTSQLFTSSWASSDLEPEEAENYEIGMRSSFWQGMIGLDVALYAMEITDKIVTRDLSAWAKQYVNAGETSHRGVEVAATLKPVDFASLSLAYTYSRNKYEEYVVDGVDFQDNYIERSPEHRLNARLAVTPIRNLWVELEMDTESSQYSDPANLHEYSRPTLFNLRANYEWDEWTFWAHLLNLTDEKHATYVSYSSSDDTTTLLSGQPLTFIAGVSYQWGGGGR